MIMEKAPSTMGLLIVKSSHQARRWKHDMESSLVALEEPVETANLNGETDGQRFLVVESDAAVAVVETAAAVARKTVHGRALALVALVSQTGSDSMSINCMRDVRHRKCGMISPVVVTRRPSGGKVVTRQQMGGQVWF